MGAEGGKWILLTLGPLPLRECLVRVTRHMATQFPIYSLLKDSEGSQQAKAGVLRPEGRIGWVWGLAGPKQQIQMIIGWGAMSSAVN